MLVILTVVFIFKIATLNDEVREQESLVAERDGTITTLLRQSTALADSLSTSKKLIVEKDSILQQTIVLYAQEQQRADRLVAKAAKLEETHARQQHKLQAQIDTCSADLTKVKAKCDTLTQDLDEAQRLSSTRLTLVDAYKQYVSNLEPHLAWLQNEAGRDWWKKFWDRGKLSKPATPFPTPPVLPATY